MCPLEPYNSTWLEREHTRKDVSQARKKYNEQSKVMIKQTTRLQQDSYNFIQNTSYTNS